MRDVPVLHSHYLLASALFPTSLTAALIHVNAAIAELATQTTCEGCIQVYRKKVLPDCSSASSSFALVDLEVQEGLSVFAICSALAFPSSCGVHTFPSTPTYVKLAACPASTRALARAWATSSATLPCMARSAAALAPSQTTSGLDDRWELGCTESVLADDMHSSSPSPRRSLDVVSDAGGSVPSKLHPRLEDTAASTESGEGVRWLAMVFLVPSLPFPSIFCRLATGCIIPSVRQDCFGFGLGPPLRSCWCFASLSPSCFSPGNPRTTPRTGSVSSAGSHGTSFEHLHRPSICRSALRDVFHVVLRAAKCDVGFGFVVSSQPVVGPMAEKAAFSSHGESEATRRETGARRPGGNGRGATRTTGGMRTVSPQERRGKQRDGRTVEACRGRRSEAEESSAGIEERNRARVPRGKKPRSRELRWMSQ